MIKEWDLRDEIMAITHSWPWPVLAFLLGCLAGWGVSFLFPTSYRAETRITVTYNADAFYRNPDDYKNWQMRQLDVLTTAPDVLEGTLNRLRFQNSYWQSITSEDLQEMLHASWRNTGVWRLSAENRNKDRAAEAVEVWTQVILETHDAASASAGDILVLDKQLNHLISIQSQAKARASELTETRKGLQTWRASVAQIPQDQPLNTLVRWQGLALAAQAAGYNPAWQSLTNEIPDVNSTAQHYLDWIDQVIISLDVELNTLINQIHSLETELATVYEQYDEAVDKSRGMSSTLVVERPFIGVWQIEALRPTGMLMLVGGMLGLLVWGLTWLIRLSVRN